jgi:hypothetical protein
VEELKRPKLVVVEEEEELRPSPNRCQLNPSNNLERVRGNESLPPLCSKLLEKFRRHNESG